MLKIATFYLDTKALPLYLRDVPTGPRSLNTDDGFFLKVSELFRFYDIPLPHLDPYDDHSLSAYSEFVHSYFSKFHLSNNHPTVIPGEFYLGWRSYFALDDLLPECDRNEYFWTGAKIEDYIMNYTSDIRKAFQSRNLIHTRTVADQDGNERNETYYSTTGLSLAALHRMATLESLEDTLQKPYSFGVCSRDYNDRDYLTEDALAAAMSALMRERIDRRKLAAMLVESSLLEVDPKTKAKRYKLTEIGKNYALDGPRQWHRSVITLLENKGVD